MTGVTDASSLPRLQSIRVSTSYVLPGPRHPSALCAQPCQLRDGLIHQCTACQSPSQIWPLITALHRRGVSETRAPTGQEGVSAKG